MGEDALQNFETFEEFPENVLEINKDSNSFYIKLGENKFVGWENMDSTSLVNINGIDRLVVQKSYFSVIDGSLITTITQTFDVNTNEEILKNENIEITPISILLNVTQNNIYRLTLEDIKTMINYKEEKAKVNRKSYF